MDNMDRVQALNTAPFPTWLKFRAKMMVIVFFMSLSTVAFQSGRADAGSDPLSRISPNAFEFSFPTLGEKDGVLSFDDHEGQVLLVVNTASYCGFTGQFADLQALWEEYRKSGLLVVAVPSNDFNQAAKDSQAAKAYCERHFDVSFPITELTHVKGSNAHPFFAWAGALEGAPRWNFNKYLIGRDGQLLARFDSTVEPYDPALLTELRVALAAQ